jgi:hypothetical protein
MSDLTTEINSLELNRKLLARNAATDCGRVIRESVEPEAVGPIEPNDEGTSPGHLIWMCQQVDANFDQWSSTRMHRWLGFIQGVMVAFQWTNLEHVKRSISAWKNTYPEDNG